MFRLNASTSTTTITTGGGGSSAAPGGNVAIGISIEPADPMDIFRPVDIFRPMDIDDPKDIDPPTELNINGIRSRKNTFGCHPVSINRQDTKGCPTCK